MAERDVRTDVGLIEELRSLTWGQRIGFLAADAAVVAFLVAASWVVAAYCR